MPPRQTGSFKSKIPQWGKLEAVSFSATRLDSDFEDVNIAR